MSNDLSKRAIACKGWRWMPGMRAVGRRNLPAAWFRVEEVVPSLTGEWADAVPDLTDPATLGCLLALVREAWGEPVAVWYPKSTETCCVGVGRMPIAQGRFWQRPSKAAALVAALEAAEGRDVSDES
jgi:hypothetical protein